MRMPNPKVALLAALLGATPALAIAQACAAEAQSHTVIPNDSAGIWHAIDGEIAMLKGLIAKGALKTVHEHAYAVRDLVRALPNHSPGLPPAALANVTGQVKFVDTLATRLDATGDANDKLGTAANLTKLENILNTIRAQYRRQ